MRMALTKQKFTSYLKAADFRTLFIEEMGWNKVSSNFTTLPTFYVEEKPFDIKAIAHRNGFQVLQCSVKDLPSNTTCKKLDIKLRKAANDYICIFIIPGTEHHQWVAPVKTNEKRDIVIIEYAEAEKAQFLYEKIAGLSFDIDEVTTIVDVKERIQGAFAVNSEKITKDFYTGFNKEHKAFADFITGIDDQVETKENKNKQWYTSVMLNRLMFCYFIQKKGFLNGDENYLRNKLHWVQEKKGKNQFFKSFYKGFLVQLFRGGLNSPKHDDQFEDIYGRIPYLNGGMFDVHQIERDYENIDIKDEAFVSLFEFFDKWRWHLDTRVTASGRDINPDVLGYIFEQYINDRAQMGAYYTKEDITEYIGRNTIIPFIFDAVARKYPEAFEPNSPFWHFIRNNGDDFIYDSVKKGIHETIPEEIACGLDANAPNLLERRRLWNNPTPANVGLPTEIWRDTIERFKKYQEIVDKIQGGQLRSFKDFITYNLNTPKIAYDYLSCTDDKKFIDVFYKELLKVTILDPTCGSGAFLFAALNLLEPLYEVCISRMEEFNSQDHVSFNEQLAEIQNKYRSNIQYFIYKSIILRNLYGVDIMAEAVEIAKLRLFLKMVAVVEVDKRADNLGLDPLPDVDFNIRCGNTLVGYASEEQLYHDLDNANDFLQLLANQELKDKLQSKLQDVADTYEVFRLEQLSRESDIQVLKDAKGSLNNELTQLNSLLNEHLYTSTAQIDYNKWLETHQPFHWMAEFYQIMHGNKGFDVIIGNPPYVVYTEAGSQYRIGDSYTTRDCSNLYAYCIERSKYLLNKAGVFGMIVPNSSISANKMAPLQRIITASCDCWISNYSWRPSKLFEGADMLLAIIINLPSDTPKTFSTIYHKWYNEYRAYLFRNISYTDVTDIKIEGTIPKMPHWNAQTILHSMKDRANGNILPSAFKSQSKFVLYYFRAVQYWFKVLDREPIYDEDGVHKVTGEMKPIYADTEADKYCIIAVLSSSLFFLNYILWSSCQVVNSRDFHFFISLDDMPKEMRSRLSQLGIQLQDDYQKNSHIKVRNYSKKGREFTMQKQHFFIKFSKSIIDDIDRLLATYYGFTEEQLDFIINYDVKYRLGEELSDES